ncbi:OmpA/MotB domain protein (plasmid) [Phocaeicola salanitronis DSM 18170]|uniref:OmpA/MotB domain protein n=1 Tax=Phocaeicola salanitronis (strain DSM 18170 / JCM 13657 / CCUG 60908 / BL78) TaxID=667015 RepID=F0R962_PHOSB|nr:OmpA family protein [Phocaeicola salanitronis]ADY38183.1 OmpA/MotB domain protein [Phocaeicola salanitronis DSM 18170]
MKKIIFTICTICLVGCKSKEMITVSNANLSEKESILIENNSNYSVASIVGIGAELIKKEQEKAINKKLLERENKLKNIPGLVVTTIDETNGKKIFKATMQNEILFKFDSHELNKNAKSILDEMIGIINEIPNTKIKVIGHTDNIGEKGYNILLSQNRAAAVGNYLRNAGIETKNITEEGKGFDEPVSSNKTEAGRAKNRRVEIFLSNDY